VLLAVNGHHPRSPARLSDKGIEAVKAAHVKHPQPREAGRQERQPIAMIERHARCVDALSAVQRERVKPERHLTQHPPRQRGIHLDREDVGDHLLRRLHTAPLRKWIH
jgi:hypothetical protein